MGASDLPVQRLELHLETSSLPGSEFAASSIVPLRPTPTGFESMGRYVRRCSAIHGAISPARSRANIWPPPASTRSLALGNSRSI
jgi:hypothetical protein